MTNTREMKRNIEELTEYLFEKSVLTRREIIFGTLKLTGLAILNRDRNSKDNRADFAKFYLNQYKKYSYKVDSTEEFLQIFALCFVEVCNMLDELEPLNELLSNQKLYNTRLRYIKEKMKVLLPIEINQDVKKFSLGKDEDGKGVFGYVTLKGIEGTSINCKNSNEIELISLLDDSNRLYKTGEVAFKNHFLQWFMNNIETILTKNQLEKFNKLAPIYIAVTDETKETKKMRRAMLDEAGMTSADFNQLKKQIDKRARKKYLEEFGENPKFGFGTNARKKSREVFTGYLKLVDNVEQFDDGTDDCDILGNRQIAVSKYIAQYYDDYTEFEIVITKGLKLEEKKEIVRTVLGKQLISNKLIRVIKKNIEQELESPIYKQEIKPAMQEWEGYSENIFAGLKEAVIQSRNEKGITIFEIDPNAVIAEQRRADDDQSEGVS